MIDGWYIFHLDRNILKVFLYALLYRNKRSNQIIIIKYDEVIRSKQMLRNFNCCKCYLKQSRDSKISKFSQPWWVSLKEERGRKGGEMGKKKGDGVKEMKDGKELE